MSIVAIVPVAQMAAANLALEEAGFGPHNFTVAAYGATGATHAALHAWDDPVFSAAVKAIAGVVTDESTGDPVARTKALIEAQGAQWGAQAPVLPDGPQAWAIGQSVVIGDLRSHNGKVWKAKVAHVTHAGWEPSAAAWAVWEEQA